MTRVLPIKIKQLIILLLASFVYPAVANDDMSLCKEHVYTPDKERLDQELERFLYRDVSLLMLLSGSSGFPTPPKFVSVSGQLERNEVEGRYYLVLPDSPNSKYILGLHLIVEHSIESEACFLQKNTGNLVTAWGEVEDDERGIKLENIVFLKRVKPNVGRIKGAE